VPRGGRLGDKVALEAGDVAEERTVFQEWEDK
jgi:hypothetical protein